MKFKFKNKKNRTGFTPFRKKLLTLLDSRHLAGFTILEVVVALGIVTMGLLGVSSLVIQNLQVQSINKNYLVASMLAQEGLELVRNVRDKNWLTSANDWKLGAGAGTDTDIVQSVNNNNYIIDYDAIIDGNVNDIDDNGAKLYLDGNNLYNHGVGTQTQFSRLIRVIDNTEYIAASVLSLRF